MFSGHTSSPLEAAETGAQTVGHSPQSCRPFWGFPRTANFGCWLLLRRRRSRQNIAYNNRKGHSESSKIVVPCCFFPGVEKAFMPAVIGPNVGLQPAGSCQGTASSRAVEIQKIIGL